MIEGTVNREASSFSHHALVPWTDREMCSTVDLFIMRELDSQIGQKGRNSSTGKMNLTKLGPVILTKKQPQHSLTYFLFQCFPNCL